MQHPQFDGVILEDKWGKTYLCSNCLFAYSELGDNTLWHSRDKVYASYFLHDLQPEWNQRQIWANIYRQARPWQSDLSGLTDFQLRDSLIHMLANDEIRLWQLTEGWGQPPEDNGIGDGGLAPTTSSAPPPLRSTPKRQGGAVSSKADDNATEISQTQQPSTSPQSLQECEALLKKAADDLAANGYVPKYSDEELRAMAAAGTLPNDRFLVRFSPSADSVDKPIAHMRDSGRHPLWMSTFDMIERADSDPALIADVFGTKYDPNKEYTLYIIDRGENYQIDGSDTFVPTFENMKSKLKEEFAGDIKPELIDQVMTPEYSEEFREHWKAFNKDIADNGQDWRDTFETKEAERFAAEYFSNSVDQERFVARQKILSEIGAWEIFTGDGLTERYSQKGKPGALEVLEVQHRPETLRILESRNAVKAIKLSGK